MARHERLFGVPTSVFRFNAAYGRSGTLWEGRYRTAVVDSERYLLTLMRYIELNAVRTGW